MKTCALLFCNIRKGLLWVILLAAGLLLLAGGVRAADKNLRPLRVGLPQSIFYLDYALVSEWRLYLQGKLHRSVEFVDNRKFADSIVQLHMGKLDFAWVTDYPNIAVGYQGRLVVVPLYKGKPFFTSYLIVSSNDTRTATLKELRGTVMAIADPNSNSHIEHRYMLWEFRESPRNFFRQVFHTHTHRDSVKAVILGLADVTEVDNYSWDAQVRERPEVGAQTRIVARSEEFGAPALMVNHFVSNEDAAAMQSVLVGMAQDPEGVKLLKRMNFDGFIPGQAKFYERLVQMKKAMGEE